MNTQAIHVRLLIVAAACHAAATFAQSGPPERANAQGIHALVKEIELDWSHAFAKSIEYQEKILSMVDSQVLSELTAGGNAKSINGHLAELLDSSDRQGGARIEVIPTRWRDREVYFGIVQVAMRGPSAFRIYDRDESSWRVMYSSTRSVDDFLDTYQELTVIPVRASDEGIVFMTSSGGYDTRVTKTAAGWVYNCASKTLERLVVYRNAQGLTINVEKESGTMTIEYCLAPDDVEAPSYCDRRVRLSFKPGLGGVVPLNVES